MEVQMASLIEKTLGEDIEQSSVATAPFLHPVEPNHASARLMALIADLNVAAVAYCFWKGSHRLRSEERRVGKEC